MSMSRTGRRTLSVVATTAVAGAALFTMQGTGNAAVGTTGTFGTPTIQASLARTLTLVGTGFKNLNGTDAVDKTAANVGIVASAATCATGTVHPSAASIVDATHYTLTVPATLTAASYKVCVPILGGSTFLSAPLTTVAAAVADGTRPVWPLTGSSAGGQSVVLSAATTAGTGVFRTGTTVYFGRWRQASRRSPPTARP